jgi:hypothetical protein
MILGTLSSLPSSGVLVRLTLALSARPQEKAPDVMRFRVTTSL